MKKVAQNQKKTGYSYTIGRSAFAKISAVEGIYLTQEMRGDFRGFEERGLSHSNRREAILKKYAH